MYDKSYIIHNKFASVTIILIPISGKQSSSRVLHHLNIIHLKFITLGYNKDTRTITNKLNNLIIMLNLLRN